MSYEYHNLTDGLAIYKQKQSNNFYVYLNTAEGDFRKSLKTPCKKEATRKAWVYYTSYHEDINQSIFESTRKSLVKTLCKDLSCIFSKKHDEVGKKQSKYKDHSRILTDEISPALGHLKIKQLEKKHIKEILENANSKTQLRVRQGAFKQLFDYAVESSLIKEYQLPAIPTVDVKKSDPRAHFKPAHLELIRTRQDEFISSPPKALSKRYREFMLYAIEFMLHTGIRTGEELAHLKFSDIRQDRTSTQIFYHIEVTAGKIHSKSKSSSRLVPLSEEATSIVLHIANKYYCKSERSTLKGIGFNSYIFRDPLDQEKMFDSKTFDQLCSFHEIDNRIEFYTLYSCRHTYITRKLKEGVDVYLIATNCGTSIEMIQEYYSKLESIMRADELI